MKQKYDVAQASAKLASNAADTASVVIRNLAKSFRCVAEETSRLEGPNAKTAASALGTLADHCNLAADFAEASFRAIEMTVSHLRNMEEPTPASDTD